MHQYPSHFHQVLAVCHVLMTLWEEVHLIFSMFVLTIKMSVRFILMAQGMKKQVI